MWHHTCTKTGATRWTPKRAPCIEKHTMPDTKNGPTFCIILFHVPCQATALFQWCNFLDNHVPAGKTALNINLDETALRLYMPMGNGHVIASARNRRTATPRPTQNASPQQTRGSFTHIVMVTDDTAVQPLLPQILIFNSHILSLRDHAVIRTRIPPNVIVLRAKSGWVTHQTMLFVLDVLMKALRHLLHTRQVILSCDAYRAHLHTAVIRRACRHGFFS